MWEEIIYKVETDIGGLKSALAGKVLFKVDPEHIPGRRGKTTRLAMLWVAQDEVHRDEWLG